MEDKIKVPKYKLGDIVLVKSDDPEKLLMSVIVGAELTNNHSWFYFTEGQNIYGDKEKHGKYTEDIFPCPTPIKE